MTTYEWLVAHSAVDQDECLLWPFGKDKYGYGRAKSKVHSTRLAHRIMCELRNGAAPSPRHVAMHSCGNGGMSCVNPSHLKWGTQKENNHDKKNHGTWLTGADVPIAKLNDQKVRKILAMSSEGMSQRNIARRFDVTAGTVQAILEGRTWRHLA